MNKKLSNSLIKRLSLLRDAECVSVLIISNSILKLMSGNQYKDIIRNPLLIKKEMSFWEESVHSIMSEIRQDFIKVGITSTGDIKKYAITSLVAFDLSIAFIGYGLGNKINIDFKKIYLDIKKRGFPYLEEELINMKEFERDTKISLLPHTNGKKLRKASMQRMFSVPIYFNN